ncbi:MAG: sulfatase [Chloroflexota bacterium]
MQEAGYVTAGFVNAYYVWPKFGFGDGYDIYQVIQSGQNGNAALVNDAAFDWLENTWQPTLQDKPLFLYLYYYDPHTIYDPPPPYDLLYDSTYTGTLTGEVYNNGERVVSGEIVPTARDIEHLKALYDGEITNWDARFGEMMTRLNDLGLLDNAIVVVTADHGQMFGEHNKWTHHNSLYEEVIRVPLSIRWSGVLSPGQVITAPVTTMDLTPTLLDLIDLDVPDDLSGQSLEPVMRGEAADFLRPIYSELSGETDPTNLHFWMSPRYEQRAVKQSGLKFIHEIRNDDGDVLYEIQPASQYELEDVSGMMPEQTALLREKLYAWFTVPTNFLFTPSIHSDDTPPSPLRLP